MDDDDVYTPSVRTLPRFSLCAPRRYYRRYSPAGSLPWKNRMYLELRASAYPLFSWDQDYINDADLSRAIALIVRQEGMDITLKHLRHRLEDLHGFKRNSLRYLRARIKEKATYVANQ